MLSLMRRRLPDLLIIVLLFVLPLLMFWGQTVGGKTLIPADNLYQYQPYAAYRDQVGAPEIPQNDLVSDLVLQNFQFKTFIRHSIAQGELPLWNPHQFSGIAFFAAGQQSLLYPFSVIYYLLPLASAYGWFMVSQLWLAGIFTFLLMRGLGIGRSGGAVASVTYQLSAFFVISAVFPMIVAAAVWLPLILLMIEFVITQRRALRGLPASVPYIAVGALALGCCVLAGHVEITYYTLIVAGYYTVARLAWMWWRGRQERTGFQPAPTPDVEAARAQHAAPLRYVIMRGAMVAAMLALGVGLGAVQFIPTFEAAQDNFRSESASYGDVVGWAHPTRDLIQFMMPNFYGSPAQHDYFDVFSGQTVSLTDTTVVNATDEHNRITNTNWGIKNYVEGALYVGILPLALAFYGLIKRRTAHQVILALLAVFALTLMFGLPTYALFYYTLPGFDQLHSPFRWVFPLTLCVAVLAGFGMDALEKDAGKWARRFGVGLIAVGGLALIGIVLARLFYPQVAPLIERAFTSLAGATGAFSDARMFFSVEAVNIAIFSGVTVLAGIIFLMRSVGATHTSPLRGWSFAAAILIAADLMIASGGFNPAVDPVLLDFTPPAITWLQNQPGEWRYTTYEDPVTSPHLINANMTMQFGLDDVRGYESIIPKGYVDLMGRIAPQVQLQYNRIAPIYTNYGDGFDPQMALESPLLDLLNVRYVISGTATTIDLPDYSLAYEDEAVRIWENAGWMPRAYLIPAERADAPILPPEYTPATITSDSGRELTFAVHIDQRSMLIVSQNYADGWRAYSRAPDAGEDEETQLTVMPAQGGLQGIYLPAAGDWTVRLVYSPQSVQVGGFASFISAVLIVLMVGIWLWRLFVGAGESASTTMRVARNSIAPIILNLFNRGIDFAFALVMLRVLGPTDSGWYFYAGIIFVWFDIFTNFGLNLYLTREVARDRSKAAHIFFNTSAMRIGLAILGVPLLLGFLGLRQATINPPINDAALIAILVLYIGLLPNSLSTGLTAVYYAFERAEVPAAVATVATINKAIFGVIVLIGGYGIIGLAAVSIITNVLTLALLGWNARSMLRRSSPSLPMERGKLSRRFSRGEVARTRILDLPLIRSMAGESWFLMLNHFLATIFFQIDVVIIEADHGAKMVGQYSVAYKWLQAINIIPSFFTQALLPVMSRQAHDDREGLKRNYILAIKLLVSVALPVAVFFTFSSEFLAGVLGGAQFLPDGAIATQLMIWSIPIGWMNSLTQYVLIALDLQRRITRAFVVAVTFNIVTNALLIPQYGYRAAALTTIASEAVLLVPFARLLHQALGSIPWWSMIWRPLAAAAVMLAVLMVGWTIQAVLALVIASALYVVVLVALRPFTSDEIARLLPLLPAPLRRAFV